MDYEKAYKDALERANQLLIDGCSNYDKETIWNIFPELAVSEDERIRKQLLDWFKGCHWDTIDNETLKRNDIISWLEKQDHKKFEEELEKAYKYADKVQYRKGYEDAKQELEKQGEQKPQRMISAKAKEAMYDKSAWSEEDKKMFNSIIEDVMPCGECSDYPTDEEREYFYEGNRKVEWLKQLKNRVQPQQKQEWSEDDEDAIGMAIEALEDLYDVDDPAASFVGYNLSFDEAVKRLKGLKPQPQNIMSEDEFAHIVGYIVQDIVANEHMSEGEKQPTKVFVEKYYNKLKPQPHWKPTDRQLSVLQTAIKDYGICAEKNVLESLYNDLKKL